MVAPDTFLRHAAGRGFDLYAGVPCSFLTPLINCAIDSRDVRYVGAANEGDAVAIASGAEIGGRRGVVLLQNSGLGNAVNPLSSLNAVFDIPVLLVVTLRGDPAGSPDEPQHALMGQTTGAMLDLLEVPWAFLPPDARAATAAFDDAAAHMDRSGRPFALVVRKGTFADHPLDRRPATNNAAEPARGDRLEWPRKRPSRREAVETVLRSVDRGSDVIVATTGYTGRMMHAIADHPAQIALVGSMGCAAPFGLGLAIARADRRIIVLDGDGAVLMRLGALATIGSEAPQNVVHICLDNEVHDSTGGQMTVSHSVDLAEVARVCGYTVERAPTVEALQAALVRTAAKAPRFIHVKTTPGGDADLPRPSVPPSTAARRLRDYLRA